MLSFAAAIYFLERPELAIICSLIVKNVAIVSLAYHLLHKNDVVRRHHATQRSSEGDHTTEAFDIFGNLLMISAIPLSISQSFGMSTLGHYTFFRQFFFYRKHASGSSLQRHLAGSYAIQSNKTLYCSFRKKITIAAPMIVLVLGYLIVPEAHKYLFIAIGCSFTFLTWARSRVLVKGHIAKEVQFNFEIAYAVLLLVTMQISPLVGFGFVESIAVSVAICVIFVAAIKLYS